MDVVVCLDVSRSMLAKDVSPDRLTRARAEIRALAETAKGDRLGLVVFAGEARVLVPLTRDLRSFAELADQADPTSVRRGGTDLGAALEAARAAFAGREGAAQAVVVLTDGEDLEGRGLAAARELRDRGVPVHAVGFGTPLGSKIAVPTEAGEAFLRDRAGTEVVSALDAGTLRRLAESTGGTYVDAAARPRPLVDLYLDRILPTARAVLAAEGRPRREDRYQGPLLAALLLWSAGLALSDRRRRRVPRPADRAAWRPATAIGLLAILLVGCDETRSGRTAYREGRTQDAFAAFDARVKADPEGASPELLYDRAVAALRLGQPVEALASAELAAKKGGAAFEARRDFVRGSLAWAQSEASEQEAMKAGAPADARDRAIALAENALAAWRSAATSRADWPEARRNVERALLRLDRLRKEKAEPKPDDNPKPPPPGRPPPKPPPDGKPPTEAPPPPPKDDGPAAEPEKDPKLRPEAAELSPAQVLRLFDLLGEKERQKQALRRTRRDLQPVDVEKDW